MTMVGGFSCHISRQKSTSVLGIGSTASGQGVRIMKVLIVKQPDLTLSSYEFVPALVALWRATYIHIAGIDEVSLAV